MNDKNVIELLERAVDLIQDLKSAPLQELTTIVDELVALNPVLQAHIDAHKKMYEMDYTDRYAFDQTAKKVTKIVFKPSKESK